MLREWLGPVHEEGQKRLIVTLLCWISDFRHCSFSSVLHVESFEVRLVQSIKTAFSCFGKERGEAIPVVEGYLAVPKSSLSQSRMFA